MTRDQISDQIKIGLGFKAGTVLDSTIVAQIQIAQSMLEKEAELPDFLKKAYSGLTTVVNTQTLNVPNDFLKEFSEDQLFARDPDSNAETPIVSEEQGEARLRFPINDVPGVPKLYSIVNGIFYFYPTPDKAYSLQGTYYAADQVLANGSDEFKWAKNLPEALIGKAGFVIASGLRDVNAMQVFAGQLGRATQKLNEGNTERDAAGSKPVIGGED